jgi:hypothetical protein
MDVFTACHSDKHRIHVPINTEFMLFRLCGVAVPFFHPNQHLLRQWIRPHLKMHNNRLTPFAALL